MTAAAKSPAPAPKLRLKWERWAFKSHITQFHKAGASRARSANAFVVRSKNTGKWSFAVYGIASPAELPTKLAAQLAAEAAARELARNKILEALALWPDVIDEYLAAKAQGEEGVE
jgi:hypothetical protein